MPDPSKAIEAVTASRPPATDRFTYLTIVGEYASPEILPTLHEILQDAQLTQDIGWDLVQILIPIPGSEACLETIARLGNPREVILSALAVLASLDPSAASRVDEGEGEDAEDKLAASSNSPKHFVILLGMLAILHKRLKVKRPSRFLASTLQTVLQVYSPTHAEMTAAVINLVHSLSGRRRPVLPTRKSSMSIAGVANPERDGDASKNAPDPEADGPDDVDSSEDEVQKKLLLSFVSCVLEAYVNANAMSWSARLLEFYNPEKIVPGRRTALQAFREDEELLERDAIVGQLMALTRDLGLSTCSKPFLQQLCGGPIQRDPLAGTDDGVAGPDDISLSTGGSVCIVAYWAFSGTVFDADQPRPDMQVFPEHFSLLEQFLEDDAQAQINTTPGTVEAIIAIGLWLLHNDRVLPPPSDHMSRRSSTVQEEEAVTNFMNYHHLLTLSAVYHPSLPVRNAATILAGLILHADPDVDDRLKILEDLLENCMFGTLKACGVTWLREELVSAAAAAAAASSASAPGPFRGPDALEAVQYAVFPNLAFLRDMDGDALLEWWAQNAPFVLQAVNFALFLFSDRSGYTHAVPEGMGAAVETRYVEPLVTAAGVLEGLIQDAEPGLLLEVGVLKDRLRELGLTERFRSLAVVAPGGTSGRGK